MNRSNIRVEKEWSVFIYANGNNDLAPEVSYQKKMMEENNKYSHSNVVMQVSLETQEFIDIVRPKDHNCRVLPMKNGRYVLHNREFFLLQEREGENMADPDSFLDFLRWGVSKFPAKHSIIIIGGHGCQFVGCSTDYSGKYPCILGYVEMNQAIEKVHQETGISFDLLFLDTCYANFIETIYEFGQKETPSVRYLLTYVIQGPIGGYPYHQLLHSLEQNQEVREVLSKLVQDTNYNMVAFEIDYKKLKELKIRFSELAQESMKDGKSELSLTQLFRKNEVEGIYRKYTEKINQIGNSLIIEHQSGNSFPLLNIANEGTTIEFIKKQYKKLGFAKENIWTKRLLCEECGTTVGYFNPVVLSPQAVYAYISIMNQNETQAQKRQIFYNLVKYKGWKIN